MMLEAAALVAPVRPMPGYARVLPLEGGRNFRDLGGYATADGRHVRWGLLFRSGSMAGLTAADRRFLDGLGIAVVCDLRRPDERAVEPTVWQGDPRYQYRTSDTFGFSPAIATYMAGGVKTGAEARAVLIAVYRDFPRTHADAYAAIFRHLAAGDVPLALHCSAGKDRTGVAAALILSALGVPRATVIGDYALTDQLLDPDRMRASAATAEMATMPPDVLAAVLRSDPAYIEAAFDEIETRHGGVEGYLRSALGLSDADIAAMRARLLE